MNLKIHLKLELAISMSHDVKGFTLFFHIKKGLL